MPMNIRVIANHFLQEGARVMGQVSAYPVSKGEDLRISVGRAWLSGRRGRDRCEWGSVGEAKLLAPSLGLPYQTASNPKHSG